MGALDGLRVIDLGVLVQAPQAAAMLGDLGADVVKVELPNFGDQARWLPAGPGEARSAYFTACNRGKRSVTLDLRMPVGRAVFLRMIEQTDVLLSNFTPGTLERWDLGQEVLSDRNPRLVHGAGSTFGPIGDDAGREGADLSAQAAAGLISATGTDDGEPTTIGVTICDHIASQNLVSGVLAALLARERTGRGQRVEVSLLGSMIWAQASEYTGYLLTGSVPGRPNHGHPMIQGVYGIFPCAEGGWVAVVGVVGALRRRFYELIGRPELGEDPRFAAPVLAIADKLALFEEISVATRRRRRDDWCALLAAAGLRYAPVRDYAEVVADPQAWVNGYFAEGTDAEGRRQRQVGTPIRFGETPSRLGAVAPQLGQDTETVLLELGYDWDEIADLRNAGAI